MEEKVKKDILAVLKKSLIAIRKEDMGGLKDLSDNVIHNASVLQDEYSISIAVIIYSLAKIFERVRYRKYKDWDMFQRNTLNELTNARRSLEQDDVESYEHSLHSLLQVIDRLGKKFRKYIIDVMNKAKISKASRMHEHGISVGKTAELLGVSEWELMDYIGDTGIADIPLNITMSAKTRLKIARRIFS